jgi:hypothetical protein
LLVPSPKKKPVGEPWVVCVHRGDEEESKSFWWQGPNVGKGMTASPFVTKAKQFPTRDAAEKAVRSIYGKVVLKQTEPMRLAIAKERVILEPLVNNQELKEQIEEARKHPENLKPRPPRPAKKEVISAAESEPTPTQKAPAIDVKIPTSADYEPDAEAKAKAAFRRELVLGLRKSLKAQKISNYTPGVYTDTLVEDLWNGEMGIRAKYGF